MVDVVVAGLRWWRNLRIAVCRRPKTCRSHDLSSISRCACSVPPRPFSFGQNGPFGARQQGVLARAKRHCGQGAAAPNWNGPAPSWRSR
jgi:hypothetical protein